MKNLSVRKIFIIIGGLMALVVIISVGFLINKVVYSATINVMVAPQTAKVTINGSEYNSKGEYKVIPGEYSAEISADGFKTKTATFTVEGGKTADLWLYLEPLDGDSDWYYNDPIDGLIVGAIRNNYTVKAVEELMNDNPILKALPVEVDKYSADYSKRTWYTISYEMAPEKTGFTIKISDRTGGNYEMALNKIRELGFNPSDFEIVYEDISKEYKNYRAE